MSPSKFVQLVSDTEDSVDRSAIVAKSVAICLIYGYPDYAKELCIQSKLFIAMDDYDFINSCIDSYVSKLFSLPDFRGKTRLSNLLFKCYELLAFSRNNADDNKLGN
jgi:hypothetical protein